MAPPNQEGGTLINGDVRVGSLAGQLWRTTAAGRHRLLVRDRGLLPNSRADWETVPHNTRRKGAERSRRDTRVRPSQRHPRPGRRDLAQDAGQREQRGGGPVTPHATGLERGESKGSYVGVRDRV